MASRPFILGAAAGRSPVVIVAHRQQFAANGRLWRAVNTDIKNVKDLKGKKVAIWPGSTQEAVILERLPPWRAWTIRDIQADPACSFSDMACALGRAADVDAYVGAEPRGPASASPTIRASCSSILYSTPIGPPQHDPVREPEGP